MLFFIQLSEILLGAKCASLSGQLFEGTRKAGDANWHLLRIVLRGMKKVDNSSVKSLIPHRGTVNGI
jgi:hypothetical protein